MSFEAAVLPQGSVCLSAFSAAVADVPRRRPLHEPSEISYRKTHTTHGVERRA